MEPFLSGQIMFPRSLRFGYPLLLFINLCGLSTVGQVLLFKHLNLEKLK